MPFFQPGEPHKPEETVKTIEEMYSVACLGVQEKLDELQRLTRVKDTIALHWIEQLISKAREMQQTHISDATTKDRRLVDPKLKGKYRDEVKASIQKSIQSELMDWIIKQPQWAWEKLPVDSRKFYRL